MVTCLRVVEQAKRQTCVMRCLQMDSRGGISSELDGGKGDASRVSRIAGKRVKWFSAKLTAEPDALSASLGMIDCIDSGSPRVSGLRVLFSQTSTSDQAVNMALMSLAAVSKNLSDSVASNREQPCR